jgi:threonylcarbamoyladenosine tRNA methylthiotransferase MtaB
VGQDRAIKVAFYTLGCKLNQAETESLAREFGEAGYQFAASDDAADVYIANTCTVTHIADRKSRHWLRLARRRSPKALIVATGCYAQRAPQELSPLADVVIGNKEKEHLVQVIGEIDGFSPVPGHRNGLSPDGMGRARSLTRIQDGCRSSCAYCIVPRVRTDEYCLHPVEIVKEIEARLAAGYKEIVLTGTKIGCYKSDGMNLRHLVEHILRDTEVERLRLSSLQPQEVSAQLLTLWQDKRLCRHFHLALQSGSDSVLQRMNRRYSSDDYRRALSLIRESVPGVAITTDVMVGFPAETDDEFNQSYRFCQEAGLANIHVFPFSPRPGTQAEAMPDQVGDRVKKERAQRMLQLARDCRHGFCQRLIGQTMPVLWEKEVDTGEGIYSGLTDNYVRVFAHSANLLSGKIAPVRLAGFHEQGLWGEPISQ